MAPPEVKRLKNRRAGEKSSTLLLAKKLKDPKKKSTPVKDLSLAKKSMLDMERERVIEEYRAMKQNKLNKVNI